MNEEIACTLNNSINLIINCLLDTEKNSQISSEKITLHFKAQNEKSEKVKEIELNCVAAWTTHKLGLWRNPTILSLFIE